MFALAVDLGTIQSTSSPVTWAIGYVRDPVVPYTTPSGATEVRRPYWTTQYSDVGALVGVHIQVSRIKPNHLTPRSMRLWPTILLHTTGLSHLTRRS